MWCCFKNKKLQPLYISYPYQTQPGQTVYKVQESGFIQNAQEIDFTPVQKVNEPELQVSTYTVDSNMSVVTKQVIAVEQNDILTNYTNNEKQIECCIDATEAMDQQSINKEKSDLQVENNHMHQKQDIQQHLQQTDDVELNDDQSHILQSQPTQNQQHQVFDELKQQTAQSNEAKQNELLNFEKDVMTQQQCNNQNNNLLDF